MSLKQLTNAIAACDDIRVQRERPGVEDGILLRVFLKHGNHRQEWQVREERNGWLDAELILDTRLGETADG